MRHAGAFEAVLSGDNYNADLAERYGWINRALPASRLGGFVTALAHRIAEFPAASLVVQKERVNAIALASASDFRRDAELFVELARNPETQGRVQTAMKRGLQLREWEADLGRRLPSLGNHSATPVTD